MKTSTVNPKKIERQWYVVDATNLILGRMAVVIADYLRGKHKSIFTPNQDCGDYIVVINAEKIVLTGDKINQKMYYHHSGYPGGLKETNAKKIIESKNPEKIVKNAVSKMITRNVLGRSILKKLFIYSGNNNPHSAQKCKELDIASMCRKNVKNKA